MLNDGNNSSQSATDSDTDNDEVERRKREKPNRPIVKKKCLGENDATLSDAMTNRNGIRNSFGYFSKKKINKKNK